MIRFHLAKLMADKAFTERRMVEIGDISAATGIHRSTLSRVLNKPGANLTAENMSRLCRFFDCTLSELAEYVSEEPEMDAPEPEVPATKRSKGKRAAVK